MSILYTKNHLTMCLSKVILCAYLIIYFIIIGMCNIIKKLHIDMIFILTIYLTMLVLHDQQVLVIVDFDQ